MSEYKDIYKLLADNFNLAKVYPPSSDYYLRLAIDDVVDVTTEYYGDIAVDIHNALFYNVVKAYESDRHRASMQLYLIFANKAINDFAINNINSDLTDFVNNDVDWDENCVPLYWAQLSEDSGYNISRWIVCS